MKASLSRVATALAVTLATGVWSADAAAVLKPGDKAPDFTTQASLAGASYRYSLADALKHGPVVLYFYPAAFTKGCTIEAHEFADAVDEYRRAAWDRSKR